MTKGRLKQLSFRQIKILIVALAMMIAFVIIWNHLYVPIKADFKKNSEELVNVNKRVKAVEGFIPQGETTQEQITKMKAELELLIKKLPEKEEESLNILTEHFRTLDIHVDSTNFSDRKLLLDDQNTKMKIDDSTVEVLLVTFKLSGSYKSVVDLLTALRESIPAYVSVVRLTVDAPREESDKLTVLLDVNMYLVSKSNE